MEKKPLIEIIEAGGELCGNEVLENEDTELTDTESTEQSPQNSRQETKNGASTPENTVHPRPHEDNANNSEASITKEDLGSECTGHCSRTTVCSQNDESEKMIREDKDIIKTMSTITIREIPLNDTKDESRDEVEFKDKENGGGNEFNRSLGDEKPAGEQLNVDTIGVVAVLSTRYYRAASSAIQQSWSFALTSQGGEHLLSFK